MFGLGSQELLVILVIVLILFGANRLPQLARSLGSSMKEFKKGIDEGKGEDGSGLAGPARTLSPWTGATAPAAGPRSRRGRHYLQGHSSLKTSQGEARCLVSPGRDESRSPGAGTPPAQRRHHCQRRLQPPRHRRGPED